MFNLVFSWLPPVAWAALIFAMSNTPDLSSGLECDFILRKAAHVTEYFILTLLVARALRRTTAVEAGRLIALAAPASFLYAVSDEIHQLFIRGRQGTPVDVAIDSLGVALAVAWLCWRRRGSRSSRGT